MTEVEFMKQIWRPYDKVVINDELRGSVICVNFLTRSVKIKVNGSQVWFKYDCIREHISHFNETEDESIVNSPFYETVETLQKRVDIQQSLIDKQKIKIIQLSSSKANQIPDLIKSINILEGALRPRRKVLEQIDKIEEILANLNPDNLLQEDAEIETQQDEENPVYTDGN